MAPDSASSAPSSKTPTHGCSTTSASIEDTTAPPVLFNLCLPQPASLSSQTGSQIYENRLLCENSSRQCIYRCPGFCPTYIENRVGSVPRRVSDADNGLLRRLELRSSG